MIDVKAGLQSMLNPLEKKIDIVIECFVEFYGEEYRKVITKRLKEVPIITGRSFLSDARVKQLIRFQENQKVVSILSELLDKYGIKCELKFDEHNPDLEKFVSGILRTINTMIADIAKVKQDEYFEETLRGKVSNLIQYLMRNPDQRKMFEGSQFDLSALDSGKDPSNLIFSMFWKLDPKKKETLQNIYDLSVSFWQEWCDVYHPRIQRETKEYDLYLSKIDDNFNTLSKMKKSVDEEKKSADRSCTARFAERYQKLGGKMYVAGHPALLQLIKSYTTAVMNKDELFLKNLRYSEILNKELGEQLLLSDEQLGDKLFLKRLLYDPKYVKDCTAIAKKRSNLIKEDILAASAIERMEALPHLGNWQYEKRYLRKRISEPRATSGANLGYLSPTSKIKSMIYMFDLNDEVLIHELNHALDMCILSISSERQTFSYACGFEELDDSYADDPDFDENEEDDDDEIRKYEGINEVFNDLIACKITDILHSKGESLYGEWTFSSSYSRAFPLYEKFFEKYKDIIIRYRLSSKPLEFRKLVGEEIFDRLAAATNNLIFDLSINIDDLIGCVNIQNGTKISTFDELLKFYDDYELGNLFPSDKEKIDCIKEIVYCIKEISRTLETKFGTQSTPLPPIRSLDDTAPPLLRIRRHNNYNN